MNGWTKRSGATRVVLLCVAVCFPMQNSVAKKEPYKLPGKPRPTQSQGFYERDFKKEAVGRLLFFDKILSGNENISCAISSRSLSP